MRIFKKAFLVLLFAFILLSLCACSNSSKSSKHELAESTLVSEKNTAYAQARKFNSNQKVTSSSMIELYFDQASGDVAVRNASTGKWWYALPEKYSSNGKLVPSILSLQVVRDGQIIELNSCTDSANPVKVTSEVIENGIKASYTLSYTIDEENTVSFTVPVEYTLVDGNFYVGVDCNNIENLSTADGTVITKVRLLNSFGASTTASSNEYLLVPDNCGGIIHTAKATDDFKDISLKVYGDTQSSNALMGVFGVKKDSDAFVCIIRHGDAIATVNAGTSKSESKYNMVGAEFDITESEVVTKKEKNYIYVSDKTYTDRIELCYRFLSGDNAGYSGMSVACREQLIRDGVLSSAEADSSGDLPMVLSVLATANTQPSKTAVLTTYEQLQDMLIHLKSKGFSNIYVKYKGALSGGDNQMNIGSAETLRSLGTSEDYEELENYMSAQNLTLFTDINCLTVPENSLRGSKCASSVTNGKQSVSVENGFSSKVNRDVVGFDTIEDNVISLISFAKDNDFGAVSVSDVATFLYSDYSHDKTRADIKDEISTEISSVSGTARLMVEKGNLYALKNAEVISDMPLNTSRANSTCYESVPFAQLVLHGTVNYSSEPINLSSDYKKAILRAVEYGAMPAFEWCYEEVRTKEETESIEAQAQERSNDETTATVEAGVIDRTYSYTQWANVAYAYYEKANKALSDLRDRRMTAHYQVRSGLYCTEYGNTMIYVNYTSKDITVNGVTIPKNDFMRVN